MHRLIANFVLTLTILSQPVGAQNSRPLVYGQTAVLHSNVLDEDRPIVISLPDGYNRSDRKYPVLYLLDGPGHIQHTSGTIGYLARIGAMPQMIIVGIGNTDRTRDLTPAISAPDAERFPTAGGADTFLKFVNDELMPFVEHEFRTQPYRVLVGHSFGGLTAVHALLNHFDMFDAYISISPSLWWDNQRLIHDAETLMASRDSFKKSLFITMGDERDQMVDSYDQFIDVLEREAPEDFRHGNMHMLDEDHGSTPLRSTIHGLKLIFDDWRMPNEMLANADLQAMDEHAAKLTERYGYEIKTPENIINQLGYRVLDNGNGDIDKAIEIFKSNVERFPGSANVYDSLGEGLEAAGQLEKAKQMYEKAFKRGRELNDPNTGVYKQHLDNVAGQTGRVL